LRSLDGAIEGEGPQKRMDADLVARELRITLGQFPGALAENFHTVNDFGRGEAARQFTNDITPRVESMGLKLELMDRASAAQFDQPLPQEIALSPALALAANWLREIAPGPEFLPPKVQPWQQLLSAKYSARKLAWAGGAVGGLVACVCVAFLIQQFQIMHYRSKWKSMETKVTELQTDQEQIKKYRSWFDDSFRALRIMRRLTEAFPEDGYVTVKTLEIRDLSVVTCSGVARDKPSYFKLIDQLSADTGKVTDVNTEQIHGQAPIEFTFNFQWEGGKPSGN
jgi:hypothetical protein